MAIYAHTRDALVEMVCKLLLHDWLEGTATSDGTTSTLIDTSRQEIADYFNEQEWAELYIRTATNDIAGSVRKITDFASGASPTITVAPVLGAVTKTGDTYSIHIEYKRDEVVEAINLAIDQVAERALFWAIDESTVTLVADTYEYNLPTSFMYLYRVTMADSDGYFYDAPIAPDQYKIIPGTTPKIHFPKMPDDMRFTDHWYGELWASADFTAGRKLRLEGLASPATLSTDSATCPISPAYIIHQAAAFLHLSRVRSPENDPDEHRIQMKLCQDRADIERARIVEMRIPFNAKRIRE